MKPKEKFMESLTEYLDTCGIPLCELCDYMPPKYEKGWKGNYSEVFDGKDKRPERKLNCFASLIKKNKLKIENSWKGVYVLREEETYIYVGQTSGGVNQRLDAHITKLTATNNGKHDHPKKWQCYAYKRYQKLKENSVKVNNIYVHFFDLKKFNLFFDKSIENEIELEALIYYFLLKKFPGIDLINSESKIAGVSPKGKIFRAKYKEFWEI